MKLRKSIIVVLLLALGLSAAAQNQIDKQGRRQGHWIRTDKNGAKIFEGDFKDGQETGTFNYYYPDGTLRLRNTYSIPGKYCKHEAYDEKGHLLATGFYNQKNRDSVWSYYNENGTLIKVASFRMGIKQGPHIIFTSKGDTAEYTTWKDNHRNGRWWKRVGENGYITGTYVHGGLEGRLVEYDENGKLCRDGNYKNGNKNGSYRYYEGGKLTIDETWNDGFLQDRKILVSTPQAQYISVTSIAYILPRQQQSTVYRMDGSVLKCDEAVETITNRVGSDNFLMVDQKGRISANASCIRGITRDTDGREILDLDPKPDFYVFPDEDCKKLVQSLQRGDEMDQ